MTSATSRRVAKLEGTLQPREAVLHWLAEAQGYPGVVEYLRSQIVGQPVEAAPISVITGRVVAAVRAERKGQPREDVDRAVHRAQGDAVFLFCLVVVLNGRALEVARVEGLRAAAVFYWMGTLLGGPVGAARVRRGCPGATGCVAQLADPRRSSRRRRPDRDRGPSEPRAPLPRRPPGPLPRCRGFLGQVRRSRRAAVRSRRGDRTSGANEATIRWRVDRGAGRGPRHLARRRRPGEGLRDRR